jgi:bleomycin hydrolase
VLDLVDEPLDSRIMEYLNRDPVGDGGQFDMAVNIVEVSFSEKAE